MNNNRWDRFSWGERLIIEDALANYDGEHCDNDVLMDLAGEVEDELRETLNDDRERDLGETEEDFAPGSRGARHQLEGGD